MIEVRLSEQIGCRDGPEAVFAVDQIALGDGASYCLVDEGLGKSEAIRGGHLHFAEELEAEAEVPGYIEFLGFEGFLDGCTGGQECEARSGEDVGAQEAADYGKSEFVLDVDGDFEVILGYFFGGGSAADCNVGGTAYVHQRGIEAEVDGRNHEFGLNTAGKSGAVATVENVLIEFEAVDCYTYTGSERKLGRGGSADSDYGDDGYECAAKVFNHNR